MKKAEILGRTHENVILLLIRMKNFWRRYKKNRAAVVGLIWALFIFLIACFAPVISTYPPLKLGVGDSFEGPRIEHLMGTDDIGRDIFSWTVYGTRVSLFVGFLAIGVASFIGILIGATAGYYGGLIDDLLMRITELFIVIPRLFLAIILVALFGNSIWNVILVIGALSWPRTARLLRAEFLSLKEREFTEAARALGASNVTIIFSEILPNALVPIITNLSLAIANAILVEAGLSFLGLGDPNQPSWGLMLNNAQRFLSRAWWMALFPGLSIFSTVLALNLVGDGLNDALNPRLRGE